MANPVIIEEIGDKVARMVASGELKNEARNEAFQLFCAQRASEAFEEYHEKMPGIKSTAKEASNICKMRGYVFNAYGRRRYLPQKASYKAFNAIIQGCAMDIMKESMIKLAPRYNKQSRDMGLRLAANVHDEILFNVPLEILQDPELYRFIKNGMENPSVKFRVPIITDVGISSKDWAEAAGDVTILDAAGMVVGGNVVD